MRIRPRTHARIFWSIVAVPQLAVLLVTLAGVRSPGMAVATPAAVPLTSAAASSPEGEGQAPFLNAPRRLSETGLYAPDGSIDPRNRPFTPQYPLWTDGAAKARWVRLPDHARVDVADLDAWRFPPGTVFWKEFSFHGRKVETRMTWTSGAGEWRFAAYAWNEEQTDAVLVPEEGIRDVVEITDGRRHSIPGRMDCVACHSSAPSPALGFSALQLSDDRDPLAPHAEPLTPEMVTLRTLVESDRLAPARPELVRNPPRIRESKPLARAALGYLSGNCGSCHNASGPQARLGLVLLHDSGGEEGTPEPALLTTLGASGRFVLPGIPPDSCHIVSPGAPDLSVLLHRMQSRRASTQMPPLGTVLVDDVAVRLVEAWIAGLGQVPIQ